MIKEFSRKLGVQFETHPDNKEIVGFAVGLYSRLIKPLEQENAKLRKALQNILSDEDFNKVIK